MLGTATLMIPGGLKVTRGLERLSKSRESIAARYGREEVRDGMEAQIGEVERERGGCAA